jgi:hypothetical protein
MKRKMINRKRKKVPPKSRMRKRRISSLELARHARVMAYIANEDAYGTELMIASTKAYLDSKNISYASLEESVI